MLIGGEDADNQGTPVPIYVPESYSGIWTNLAAHTSPRRYHSTALLLKTGNVLSAGGDTRTKDYEVFQPGYNYCSLVKPVISSLSSHDLTYGGSVCTVNFNQLVGVSIQDVLLMRPGSVTHHFDMSQRCHKVVTYNASGTSIQFAPPPSSAWAPRGTYMLFLVTNAGGVSDAEWVKLQ